MGEKTGREDRVLREIEAFITRVRYGEVIITVHDSRVVQIEKREKKRFDVRGPDRGQG